MSTSVHAAAVATSSIHTKYPHKAVIEPISIACAFEQSTAAIKTTAKQKNYVYIER